MDKFKLVVVAGGAAAMAHSVVADFSAAAHGQTIPVKAPPKASITVAGSTSALIERFDAVLGKQLPIVPPHDFQRRLNQG